MSKFEMKYPITNAFIENPINRPKTKRPHTLFLVAHDTGNVNSTARNNINYMNRAYDTRGGNHFEKGGAVPFRTASAHVFIDDKDILVGVPLDEKAWHVLYNVTTDNKMFGDDANDASVGVELCFFADLNRSREAYKRFVWFFAFLLDRFELNWNKITFHSVLDPGRKVDPKNAFDRIGVTYQTFLEDVRAEYNACLAHEMTTKETVDMTKEDANKLIELCKLEWAKANAKQDAAGKAEWARLANVLREASGQPKQ